MHTSGVPSLKPLAPLNLAAAVAAASSGSASAQVLATAAAGDMAIVPYYTVHNNYATGLSIANNSDNTQVVKVRLRRATSFSAVSHVGERAIGVAQRCAAAWGLDEHSCCAIEVMEIPRQHIGLGTGTQLALAIAAGMQRLYVEGSARLEQTYTAKAAAAALDYAAKHPHRRILYWHTYTR